MYRNIDEPLPLRILTVVLLIAGFFCIYRPAESHLADVQSATRRVDERSRFGENFLARRDVYEHAAERMRKELSGVNFDADDANMMAAFLADIDERTQRHEVRVAEISPDQDAARRGQHGLTLHVRGRYRSIVAFLNEVGTMHTLVRIEDIRLTRIAGDVHAGQTPGIDAAIRTTLVPVRTQTSGGMQ